MVATIRSTLGMASRRRSFATILYSAAARHAYTPQTLVTPTPAANSAGATFQAVRTLQRDHFDVKVAKAVQRKLFESKEDRLSGSESHASALRNAFVTEDLGVAALLTLDNATLAVRVKANALLLSTLELLIHPTSPPTDWMDSSNSAFPSDGKRVLLEIARRLLHADAPFQGQSDMLGVRGVANADPHDAISGSNVRTDEINRAAHDLLTIQQWVRECYAAHVKAGADTGLASALRYTQPVGDTSWSAAKTTPMSPRDTALADYLRIMVLALKRQLAAFTASDGSAPSPRGYIPRADKPGRRMKTRFAAKPLAERGNWPQGISKKVVFHRGTSATVPYCQNAACAKGCARRWHRDCPNGGKGVLGLGMLQPADIPYIQ
ncbi:hypothetical protein CYMTET_12851 [Cymbomonas tetramitiformis]|uniref:Uncharacterized protein n=1 Tax=Cymbomonas tetramitiformis TaxID=36881 RepID=A0AAE0LBM2_9CHLO|nr:hypothetical protein CYMTET_12851 [Cymbomonas tetramitiformis]